jgi:NRPS condensation-like uncharacterized protein
MCDCWKDVNKENACYSDLCDTCKTVFIFGKRYTYEALKKQGMVKDKNCLGCKFVTGAGESAIAMSESIKMKN